jgi:hypothetical protein
MDSRNSQTILSALWEKYRGRVATGSGFGRRAFLRSGTGIAAVSAVGISGLLELLANREALAAGNVIPIVGVTREPFMAPDETPHRHTFSVRFHVTDVSDTAIMGIVVGRTESVIARGIISARGSLLLRRTAADHGPHFRVTIDELIVGVGLGWRPAAGMTSYRLVLAGEAVGT